MNLTIRNLPEDIHARLKTRAKVNGRSLNKEAINVLGIGSMNFHPNADELFERIRKNRESMGVSISQDEITRMIREDRDGGH